MSVNRVQPILNMMMEFTEYKISFSFKGTNALGDSHISNNIILLIKDHHTFRTLINEF